MTYPIQKLLEKPDESGYAVTEYQNSLASANVDGGMPRTRLDEIGAGRFITVKWSGQPKRFQKVRDFFTQNLALNCPQFKLDLIVSDSGYDEYLCRILPNTIKTATPVGLYWVIQVTLEVAPRDDEPLLSSLLLGLRFDNNFLDEAGNFIFTDSGVTFETISPKFGIADAVFDGTSIIYSDNRDILTLGNRNFQISGWVTLDNYDSFHTLFLMQAGVSGGGGTLFGGDAQQILIGVDVTTLPYGQLRVLYPCIGSGDSLDAPEFDQGGQRLKVIDTTIIELSTATHIAVVQDETSFRAYVGGVKVAEDITHRLYYATDFTNQCVIMGAAYAGGGWPGAYAAYLHGKLDDWSMKLDTVDFTGDSFTPPTQPFKVGLPLLPYAPDQANYAVSDGSDRLASQPGPVGNYRRNLLNTNRVVDVSWQCDAAMYSYLAEYYRTFVSLGGDSFECDLFLETTDLKRFECVFVYGSFGLSNIQGETYSVKAQFSVKPDVYDVDKLPFVNSGNLLKSVFSVNTGTYILSGKNVLFGLAVTHFGVDAGVYTLGGINAKLMQSPRSVPVDSGSYSLTGIDINTTIIPSPDSIFAETGIYNITGNAAGLNKALANGILVMRDGVIVTREIVPGNAHITIVNQDGHDGNIEISSGGYIETE